MGRNKSTTKIKKCKKCEVTKSKKFFYATSSYCKKCHREKVIENQKKNSDYYNEYRAQYAKTNPEKCKAWVEITKERWEEENGVPYSTFAYEIHKKRMVEDSEYEKRVRQTTKKYRTKNKEKLKAKREKYYQDNRDLLCLKARLRYYKKEVLLATNHPEMQSEYEKRIKMLEDQIKEFNLLRKII